MPAKKKKARKAIKAKAATKAAKKVTKKTKIAAKAAAPKAKAKAKSAANAHPRYLVIDASNSVVTTTRELTPYLRDKAKHGLSHIVDTERMLGMTPLGAWAKIEDSANVKESPATTAAYQKIVADREAANPAPVPAPTPVEAAPPAPAAKIAGATDARLAPAPAPATQGFAATEEEDEEEAPTGARASDPGASQYLGESHGFNEQRTATPDRG